MAILTVTLNPAIDLETRTPRLQTGEKLRCDTPGRDPGGGGINVARAICQLGGQATALIAAGGPTGSALRVLLQEKSVPVEHLPAPGEVRQNMSVIETETGAQYRFIFPGPTWSTADTEAMKTALLSRVQRGDWIVLSGSVPPGMSHDTYFELARGLSTVGAFVVADTSGPALQALTTATDAPLRVLRVDHEESEAMIGHPLTSVSDSAQAAAAYVAKGVADIVILARGAEGSVLADASGAWFAPAVNVEVRSRTGAGDSFVAGAVWALSDGRPIHEVLQWGCAAASAAVMTAATDLCDANTFHSLLPASAARPV